MLQRKLNKSLYDCIRWGLPTICTPHCARTIRNIYLYKKLKLNSHSLYLITTPSVLFEYIYMRSVSSTVWFCISNCRVYICKKGARVAYIENIYTYVRRYIEIIWKVSVINLSWKIALSFNLQKIVVYHKKIPHKTTRINEASEKG